MKVQILGTGCLKCRTLAANAEAAVAELGLKAEVEKVENIHDIAAMGVALTPALVVDGHVKTTGRLLSVSQIARLLS
jgi:small redox-active disulfide protein 2